MKELLNNNLTSVNDWLKFAETKLTVLITVNGAAILAGGQILGLSTIPVFVKAAMIIFIGMTILSILMALVAMIPKVKIPSGMHNGSLVDGESLLFYGNIAKYSKAKYAEKFSELIGYRQSATAYEMQIIEQIIVNSRICVWKYALFGWSIRLAFYAVLACGEVLLIGTIISII